MLNAWVTYADSSLYVNAAKVLFKSLQLYGTNYECVLMVPDGDMVLDDIPSYIRVKPVLRYNKTGDSHAHERYKSCSNKIHCWTLIEYDKVCWLDCDLVIIRNIDELFDTHIHANGIAAARGCRCNIFNNMSLPTLPEMCPFTNKHSTYVNAGVILLRPSMSIFRQLQVSDFDHPFADQDTFNIFFADNIQVLSSDYNYLNHLHIAHPNVATKDIAVYHFGYGKP